MLKQSTKLGHSKSYPVGPIKTNKLIHTDHSKSANGAVGDCAPVARGGVVTPFQFKLHSLLDENRFDLVISWQPHGRSFVVHKPVDFVQNVMPMYFNQTKYASFQRQLNLYGFRRITHGRDKGAYYHEYFLRGQRSLCQGMTRQKIKGTKVRRAVHAGLEPDFWKMTFLPHASSSSNNATTTNLNSQQLRIQAPNSTTSSGPPTPTLASETPAVKNDQLLFFEGKPFHYLDKVLMTNSIWNTMGQHQDVGV